MIARLTDPWFKAWFYGNVQAADANGRGESFHRQPTIDGAQGIVLYCPCGYGKPDEHAHDLLIPFANPRNAPPCPESHGPFSRDGKTRPRWTMTGTGLDDLTLTPSVDVGKTSCWHGFITDGVVT
jgi:hypothetical protein